MADGLWYPANLIERELAWALSGSSFARYFEVFTQTDLFVPQQAGAGEEPEDWEPVTQEVLGVTVVPVFTSDEALLAGMGQDVAAFLVTTFEELRATWPDPRWRLAINPGLPIAAYLPVETVTAATRDELLPTTDPDILIQRLDDGSWTPWPPGGPEEAMLHAVSLGDGAEYLDALLACMVTVPTLREVSEAEAAEHYRRVLRSPRGRAPGAEAFPWRPVGSPHGRIVEVFTNQGLFAAAYPQSPSLTTIFQSLFDMLPAGCGVAVNPGGPGGLDLAGERVPLLAGWRTLDPVPQPVLLGMRWAAEALDQRSER